MKFTEIVPPGMVDPLRCYLFVCPLDGYKNETRWSSMLTFMSSVLAFWHIMILDFSDPSNLALTRSLVRVSYSTAFYESYYLY
jgi:hypothetical protein